MYVLWNNLQNMAEKCPELLKPQDYLVLDGASARNLAPFMQTLTEELGVTTYIKQFRKNISAQNPSSITLDMTNYTYSSSDVIQVYINGLLGVVGEDYSINVNGGVAAVSLIGLTSTTLTQDIDIRVFKAEIGIVNSVPNS